MSSHVSPFLQFFSYIPKPVIYRWVLPIDRKTSRYCNEGDDVLGSLHKT